MGFWEKLFKGKLFEDKRDPSMVCLIELFNEQYVLSEFDLSFDRENVLTDYVSAYAVFDEKISREIESWITNSSKREDATIRFYQNSKTIEQGALFEIKLKDVVCKNFRRSVVGDRDLTTITMAVKRMTIESEEL